jgi:predicted transcriptional regulator
MKFFRIYKRSFDLFKTYSKYENAEFIFQTIADNTCYGNFVKRFNQKKIQLQNGDIKLTERELAILLNRSPSAIHRLLNKLVNLGIFIKSILRKNIVVYSWSEIIFEKCSDAFELAKNLSKKTGEDSLYRKVSKWIIGKTIDVSKVCERINLKNQPQGEQVHYNDININLKKEKEERKDISSSNSTRDVKENGGSESSFSCDFDPSFGENDEKAPEIIITPKDLVEKMRSIGKLPYEKEREKKKYDVPVRKISKNEIDVENEKKKFQTIKAAQYFFGNESLAVLIQTMAMKGIDSVYRFFYGKTRNCSPSEILEEMRRDPYFVKERIDTSLEKLLMEKEILYGN